MAAKKSKNIICITIAVLDFLAILAGAAYLVNKGVFYHLGKKE
jgi:hypothetical protein